ncbi:MAG TPA: prepilin-type N-terminal cleavage/methylation domain-containing protein [Bacillota bacterium]|nr:prepilin-type N-terminal cleavage/methylation domain-containing protein [Bacillota bacterium]
MFEFKKEKGLTLIEVLVSIVLLSLILIMFFSMFIQTAKVNNSSETIIDATYIAQTEMERIYSYSKNTSYSKREDALADLNFNKVANIDDWIIFEKNDSNSDFKIVVKLQKQQLEENMNRLILEVYNGDDNIQAKMENAILWRAD